ncbi:SDR family oxidoreductase [Chloroflexota bacterium]
MEKIYALLAGKCKSSRLFTYVCDVTYYDQVQILRDVAKGYFGNIDIWINDEGIGHPETEIWTFTPDRVKEVIDTNLTGAIYGSVIALKGMLGQGFGSVYNMEGLGSNGPIIGDLALYGTSKSALSYLTKSMVKETQGILILVGEIIPGMVATKLITEQYDVCPEEWECFKSNLNILSDRVETVTPWLARKVLNNYKNGVNIMWLSMVKILKLFLIAPFYKRKIFD